MPKKVVVGMSGGVDSSVAAYLLKKQGYEVIGVTMQIWQDEDRETVEDNGGCCGLSAVDDARRVAARLDIPYYVLNFKRDFKEKVIDYFIDEYLNGATPNPCIACNRYVKWESMLSKALAIGADYIATGHYAKVTKHPVTGRYTLALADTDSKDQTYALYNLTQDQLSHTLMPVGDYEKTDIREIAREIGLAVADKPDSQDICFVPDGDYATFIAQNSNAEISEGDFVDKNGKVLGRHKGICHYTVGQRKGLGLAFGVPMYVCGIDCDKNQVVLGGNEELFKCDVLVRDFNWMAFEKPKDGETLEVMGKLRYSQSMSKCKITPIADSDLVSCVFDEPQRAVTPGQAAVFYSDGYVVGGGVIVR
jgi:tRNA-specific 2-thiouridylase